jgi:RNA-directed DNA polymerase
MDAISLTQHSFALKAKHNPEHRYKDLYHIICRRDWIEHALSEVLTNKGARTAGVDGVTRKDFADATYYADFVKDLQARLKSRAYQPTPAHRKWIPKPKGGQRPLGICIIRDRVVQMLLKMLIEPIAESDFLECSYGFRPGRRTMDCIGICRRYIQSATKYYWIVEGDIKGCFNHIRHDHLMTIIQQRIADRQVLILIERFLKAGVLDGQWYESTQEGVPQGSVVSPLLANLYLHQFDLWWWKEYGALTRREKRKRRQSGLANCRLVRYADDWLLLANGERTQAEELREQARQFLWDDLGLELNIEKTRITHAKDGFEFVGFHLQWLTPSNRKPWLRVAPTPDNIKRLKHKIRQMTNGRQISDPYLKVVALNRVLQGWILYYRHTNVKYIAHKLDWWVFWRLTRWLQRHHKWRVRRVWAEYQHQQYGRRKNLAVRDGQGRLIFLYRMSDLAIKHYYTRNYPNPYIDAECHVTHIEGEAISPVKTTAWQGSSRHAEWYGLRRQVLQRDGYTCQGCGGTDYLEIHHIKARHQGGTDSPENLITLCETCHIQSDDYRARFGLQGKRGRQWRARCV